MRDHRIIVIPGDGIGPEIVEAALNVFRAVQEKEGGFSLHFEEHLAGAAYYAKHGRRISEETIKACRTASAIFKGPVGDPSIRTPEGTEAGILGAALGGSLDLFANVRPIKLYPKVYSPLRDHEAGAIDYVFVKEHTEGFLASQDKGVGREHAVADVMLFTRPGIERVMRFAFDLAQRRAETRLGKGPKVTCVDKSNVLKSYALFREVFSQVASEYPDIKTETLYSDTCAHDLVRRPEQFDILVTDYFIGDMLSDLGAATVGGLGMCPSGCYGKQTAYFDPVHGSAPHIARQGVVNPIGQILSGVMMLEKIGEHSAAARIERAVWRALDEEKIRLDQRGRATQGTLAVTEAVIEEIESE